MNRKIWAVVAVIALASMALYMLFGTPKEPEGKITVSGAFALYPMMVKWAEEYQKIHPKVKFEISAGGAGKGMTDALSGMVDIGMISRQIYPPEVAKGAFWVAVVKDAVVPTVNRDNPVLQDMLEKGVNRTVFMGIFINGTVTTWGQVVGRPEIKDAIHVYTRSDSAGAADVWSQFLGGTGQADLKGIGVNADPGLVEAVKSDPLGIGYNNINYAYDNQTGRPVEGITIAPIDLNENGQLNQNESFYNTKDQIVQAIATGAYPSPPARELNLVTKEQFNDVTKSFVEWVLSDGQQYALETGYIPLSDARRAEELKKLEG